MAVNRSPIRKHAEGVVENTSTMKKWRRNTDKILECRLPFASQRALNI